MKLHPQLIEKEGKKEFVVLPYDEFLMLEDILEDYGDLQSLREEKKASKGQATVDIEQVAKDILSSH